MNNKNTLLSVLEKILQIAENKMIIKASPFFL